MRTQHLGLCNGVMGVRALPPAVQFYSEFVQFFLRQNSILTDPGYAQTNFNIFLYEKGLRIDSRTLEGQSRKLGLIVSVADEKTMLSPCHATVLPSQSFAHANCLGAKNLNATYHEHAYAKEAWFKEQGYWFI